MAVNKLDWPHLTFNAGGGYLVVSSASLNTWWSYNYTYGTTKTDSVSLTPQKLQRVTLVLGD